MDCAGAADMEQLILFHAHACITHTIAESLRYTCNGFSEEREWRLFMTDCVSRCWRTALRS